jgi:hypothetical protein
MASRFLDALKPGWLRVGLSVFPAYVLGWLIGPLILGFSQCANGETDCAAYSPTRIVLSYVLSWPLIVLVSLLAKYAHIYLNFGTINPLAPEFVFLWFYYYLLVSVADYLVRRRTRKSSEPLKANQ